MNGSKKARNAQSITNNICNLGGDKKGGLITMQGRNPNLSNAITNRAPYCCVQTNLGCIAGLAYLKAKNLMTMNPQCSGGVPHRMYRGCHSGSGSGSVAGSAPAPTPPPPPATTILRYNQSQGPSFIWGGVTFSLDPSLPNFSYTATTTTIPGVQVPGAAQLISVVIGNTVTSIGQDAFNQCTNLTSIAIPNSVTSIGSSAFYGCTNLTSVVIGNSVTSIGVSAFYECTNLTSVVIPNSVASIGDYAFYGCTNLTSVTIGNSVTSIGDFAFYQCTNLTSIAIPTSVTSIGSNAFFSSGLVTVTIANSQVISGTSFASPASGVAFFGATVATVL